MSRKSIKFLKGYSPYNAGEVATFETTVAKKLVSSEYAEFVEPDGGPRQNRAITETESPRKKSRKKSAK